MYPRLVLLRDFLSKDGFIIFHIDDAESHYAKVLMDEVFGRSNYQTSIYVQVRYTSKTLKSDMAYHKQIEQALVYRHSWGARPYKPSVQTEGFDKFNFDISELAQGRSTTLGGKAVTIFRPGEYEIKKVAGHVDGLKEIWATGSILDGNSSGRFFRDYLAGRFNEDGAGARHAAVAPIGGDPQRSQAADRQWLLCLSVDPYIAPAHVRKHAQRRPAADGLWPGRDDRPRLSVHRQHPAERVRKVEPGRHRARAGPQGQ